MNADLICGSLNHGFFLSCALLLVGCSRAPSVDVLGSFFPAWLVCFIVSIMLTALVRLALWRLHIRVALPTLMYPSLAAVFSFVLWLIFYY